MNDLKLYCDTHQLSSLRDFLNTTLKATGLNEVEILQLILAVEEVCANMIIHSHSCDPDTFIHLKTEMSDDSITFEITDSGQGFNLLEYREPELEEVVKTKRKGGLGIMLVKKIMDKIEFETNGFQNTCRLIKNLNSK